MDNPKQNNRPAQRTYYLRGMGVLCLVALLFMAGIWRFGETTLPASSKLGDNALPIFNVDTDKKQVALSFDAAWGNEDTDKILEILANHKVNATFFVTGGWVATYPEDVKKIIASGHDLGNHSDNHRHMKELSNDQCRQEIMNVNEKVKVLTGLDMNLFRPPYGEFDNHVINSILACGYYPIEWNVDSLDWKDYGVESIVKTVTQNKNLSDGAIIRCNIGTKYTADALDTMIIRLQEQGYEIVPVSKLIMKDNYRIDNTGKQIAD